MIEQQEYKLLKYIHRKGHALSNDICSLIVDVKYLKWFCDIVIISVRYQRTHTPNTEQILSNIC